MKKLFTILASAMLIGTSVAAVHQTLSADAPAPEKAAKAVAKSPILPESELIRTVSFDVTDIPQDETYYNSYETYDEATESYNYIEYNQYCGNHMTNGLYRAWLEVEYGQWSEDGVIVDGNKPNNIGYLHTGCSVADNYSTLNATFYCEDMVGIDAEHPISHNYAEECPVYYGDNCFTISITQNRHTGMDDIDIQLGEGQSMKIKHIDYQINMLGADYISDLGNGNYIGFCLRDYDYDFAPEGTYAMIYRFATDAEEFEFPATVEVNGKEYDVLGIGTTWFADYGDMWSDEINSDYAPNCKTVRIPESVKGIRFDQCDVDDIYVPGEVKRYTNFKENTKLHVNNRQAYIDYTERYGGERIVRDYPMDWVTINVATPGTWVQEYIKVVGETWSVIERMKVTGNLNNTDLIQMAHLEYLDKIDLSETNATSIPSNFMANSRNSIRSVKLPSTVTNIEESAFNGCNNLEEINLENVEIINRSAFWGTKIEAVDLSSINRIEGDAFSNCPKLKSVKFPKAVSDMHIGDYAFWNCDALESVELPEGLSTLEHRSFADCDNLKSITLPSTLRYIRSEALQYCRSLTEVNIPEGVTYIESRAFEGCESLEEVSLPTTLTQIDNYVFNGCPNLTTVKCGAVMPPTAPNSLVSDLNVFKANLYVLPFTKELYRNADGWLNFMLIGDLMEHVDKLYVDRPLQLQIDAEYNELLSNNPEVELDGSEYKHGQLTLSGSGTFSAGKFSIKTALFSREQRNDYYWSDNTTTMINKAENMRADAVTTRLQLQHYGWAGSYVWYFVSFPYDVKISDIVPQENVYWIIRGYDAAARAQGEFDKTWRNLNEDYILQAGKGYIMTSVNPKDSYGYTMSFDVPALNNSNKNKIFTTGDVNVTLEEQASEYIQNRSWNLIGNPYPAYYQLNTLKNFTAPVTIWRGSSYVAYSPIDDDIILRPNEAFFVQCPTESNILTFAAEGRLHHDDAYKLTENSYNGLHAPANISVDGRNVFNFEIASEKASDRTRVVLNPEAKSAYEMSCDAPKFFAENATPIELYTTADGIDYSINERPIADGIVTMGVKATAGEYTISLSGKYSHEYSVLLTDNLTGEVVDLTSEDYTFVVSDNYQGSRFTINFVSGVNGIESIKNQIDADTEITLTAVNGMVVYQGAMSDMKAKTAGIYVINANGKTYKTFLK